jgi:hypothetical protein
MVSTGVAAGSPRKQIPTQKHSQPATVNQQGPLRVTFFNSGEILFLFIAFF